MNETSEFLDNFSSIKDSPIFWSQFSKFTKNIGKADTKKLVENIPELISKIGDDGASYELYKHLVQACEKDIKFGKQLYNEIIPSECEKLLSVLHFIISGVSKNDYDWSKARILELLENSNKIKLEQAISAIGLFNFSKNDSKEFIKTIEKKFIEIIQNNESGEVLASIVFACINKREDFYNADQIILSLLEKDSQQIKIQLLNVFTYKSETNLNEEFYKKILGSLVSLDLQYKVAYNSLAFRLKNQIENNFTQIKEFLHSWISYSKENARNIKLFKPILDETYHKKPEFFKKTVTEWLNEDSSNFHIAVFSLMREMNNQDSINLKLDSTLIQSYDFRDIEFISKKIIGYVLHHKIATSLLYSILENRYDNQKTVLLVGNIFTDYLIFNYYSTIDFLKERKKETKGSLKKVITKIILEGEKYYSAFKDLEVLKEFEPSESRLTYMNKIQNKKFNKSYEQSEEKQNSLMNFFTTLHFRAGKTAFGKFNNEYSNPMQPQLISHSAEMPRGEYIDPTTQAQLRLECQIFTRRK